MSPLNKEQAMKVLVRLDLSNYSVDEILELLQMKVLTRSEVELELLGRGISDITILLRTRAALAAN